MGVGLAVLVVVLIIAGGIATADDPVRFQWREGGVATSTTVQPETGFWISLTDLETGETVIGWGLSPSSTPAFFKFTPDHGRWSTGTPPLRGDMNDNGRLDFADVVLLFRDVATTTEAVPDG